MTNREHELELWNKGYRNICSIDEVGRGPFSGPVCSVAAILSPHTIIEGLTDSKQISKKKLPAIVDKVKQEVLCYAIGEASVEEIDRLNIKQATRLAMLRAVENLPIRPDYLLIDGTEVVNIDIPQHSVVKGDLYCQGISAASVIAKLYRDELMAKLDEEFGGRYNWANNAGYINKKHLDACIKYGLTRHHRKSWKTYNEILEAIEKGN